MGDIVTAVFLIFIAGLLYLIPAIIASQRHHHQSGAILMVNLFLGWTALGWLAALVWSMTAVKPELSKDATKQCPACAERVLKEAKVCRFCGKDLVAG